jgi:hypothetical protein
MSTMFEQNKIKTEKQLRNEGKSEYYFPTTLTFYKHLIKCRSCSWNVSYSEHSGSLDVSAESIFCPVCKEGKIDSSKYLQYR